MIKNDNLKIYKRMYFILLLPVAHLSYIIGGCYTAGSNIIDIFSRFQEKIKEPFANYYNEYTVKFIIGGIILFSIIWLMYMLSIRNYMFGREYGSMKMLPAEKLNKILAENRKQAAQNQSLVPVMVNKKFGSSKIIYINTNERRLSQNVSMSLNTRQHGLNDNLLVIGGSGSGKTFYVVKPNILNMTGSFIITDPKGEILRDTGAFLEKNGYVIKVINFLDAEGIRTSTRYNPFKYLRSETDVLKFVTNIFESTDDKNAMKGDPFWDNAGKMLLKALVYYVWMEEPEEKKNIGSVLDLLSKADFKVNRLGAKEDSELDKIFAKLEKRERQLIKEAEEKGEKRYMHPAVEAYNQVMKGAPDTIRSIIITLSAKMDCFRTKEIREMLSEDEINIPEIGCGAGFDGKTKTALFCVIPDNDSTFNFLISTLYTQIFQLLYFTADFVYGGRLPIHVTFMMDEFANVSLPDNYLRLLSTMRSREISCVIILQNMVQIKELFEKGWQSIPGNCDTQIFLGSSESETSESISKQLGKATIDKKTTGETKGRQGSSSRNYDVLGRELMMPEEVRLLDNKKCLVFVRGQYPCLDDKTKTMRHPLFNELTGDYTFDARKRRKPKAVHENASCEIISGNVIQYADVYAARQGRSINVYTCTADDIINMDFSDEIPNEFFVSESDTVINREKFEKKKKAAAEKKAVEQEVTDMLSTSATPDTVRDFMKLLKNGYSYNQIAVLLPLLSLSYTVADILEMISPQTSLEDTVTITDFMKNMVNKTGTEE